MGSPETEQDDLTMTDNHDGQSNSCRTTGTLSEDEQYFGGNVFKNHWEKFGQCTIRILLTPTSEAMQSLSRIAIHWADWGKIGSLQRADSFGADSCSWPRGFSQRLLVKTSTITTHLYFRLGQILSVYVCSDCFLRKHPKCKARGMLAFIPMIGDYVRHFVAGTGWAPLFLTFSTLSTSQKCCNSAAMASFHCT